MEDDIRRWFLSQGERHNDFFVASHRDAFSVIPPRADDSAVLYGAKNHCLLKLAHDCGSESPFSAVTRGGLPSDEDVSWLASLLGTRRLIFFGDADPVDLLIFAYLRSRLPIEYGGLSDLLLENCGVVLEDHLTIDLDEAESAALPLVRQHLEDLPSLLGPGCSSLLSSGKKLEVEALFGFATTAPIETAAALLAK